MLCCAFAVGVASARPRARAAGTLALSPYNAFAADRVLRREHAWQSVAAPLRDGLLATSLVEMLRLYARARLRESCTSEGLEPQLSDQTSPGFTPKQLDKTVVAIPLLEDLEEEKVKLGKDPDATPKLWKVVIDVNLEYGDGRAEARAAAAKLIKAAVASHGRNKDQGVNERKSERSPQYLFASLEGDVIREVVRRNDGPRGGRKAAVNTVERAIFRIWPDFPIGRL